jgi:membrane carboxypeptidase/penicillin-binding protein PbpC
VTAASIVVIENRTGEILAYVGSPDIEDEVGSATTTASSRSVSRLNAEAVRV